MLRDDALQVAPQQTANTSGIFGKDTVCDVGLCGVYGYAVDTFIRESRQMLDELTIVGTGPSWVMPMGSFGLVLAAVGLEFGSNIVIILYSVSSLIL